MCIGLDTTHPTHPTCPTNPTSRTNPTNRRTRQTRRGVIYVLYCILFILDMFVTSIETRTSCKLQTNQNYTGSTSSCQNMLSYSGLTCAHLFFLIFSEPAKFQLTQVDKLSHKFLEDLAGAGCWECQDPMFL